MPHALRLRKRLENNVPRRVERARENEGAVVVLNLRSGIGYRHCRFSPNFCRLLLAAAQAAFSQLIIHGMPNWSTSMPNLAAQNVSWIGIVSVPFAAKA